MNNALWVIILCTCATFIFAGWGIIGKKSSLEQWSIGNRSFGVVLVFFLTGGELYTTFTFLGGSSIVYNRGGLAYYIICYSVIGYVLSYWLAPLIWKYAKEKNLLSQPDYFASKYKSNIIGVLVSVIAVCSLIPYLLLQVKGLGIIISETSYGLVSANTAIWLASILMVVYVVLSGLKGAARIAVVKDLVIVSVVLFLGLYFPLHYYGGVKQLFTRVEMVSPGFTIIKNNSINTYWFFSTVILSALGMYLWPHAFCSIYAAKSERVLRRNAVLMPIYELMLLFIFIVGFVAFLQLPHLDKPASDLSLLRLLKLNFSHWFVGVVGFAGLLTALVPGSIILLSTATLLVKNIYYPLVSPGKDINSRLVKLAVPIIMLISLIVNNISGNTIVELLIVGYGLVVQIFPALVFSLYKKNPANNIGIISGMLCGMLIMFNSIYPVISIVDLIPNGLNIGIVALVVNFAVTTVISLSFILKRLCY